VQLASTPGIHGFGLLGTLVEGSAVPGPEPLGPVGVMVPLEPTTGVVLGGTVFPADGMVPGFSLPGVVLEPCPWPGATPPAPLGAELELSETPGVFSPGLLGEGVTTLPPELLGVGLVLGPVGVIPVPEEGLDPPFVDGVGGVT
jgi:hypothetical protein